MMNKRNFLKGGATALIASAGTPAVLVATRSGLDDVTSQAGWLVRLGQTFDVDGHAVMLQAVQPLPSQQPGEQFSLAFTGSLPAGVGDGLHLLKQAGTAPVQLYLARTPQGLRADFCRLTG